MGNTLYLTIDARVQYIAETAMRHAGLGRGAVVVMDPRNGDVLALVSIPSYDPNKFIPKIQRQGLGRAEPGPDRPDVQPRPACLRARDRPTRSWSRWPG